MWKFLDSLDFAGETLGVIEVSKEFYRGNSEEALVRVDYYTIKGEFLEYSVKVLAGVFLGVGLAMRTSSVYAYAARTPWRKCLQHYEV